MESERKAASAAFAEQGLWSIGEAGRGLLAPALSPAFVSGMTGGAIRTVGEAPTYTDIQALLIPGLAALGVHAELAPLPEENAVLLRLLRERLRRGIPVPVFAITDTLSESRITTEDTDVTDRGVLNPCPSVSSVTIRDSEGEEIPAELGPVTQQGLVVRIEAGGGLVAWREAGDAEKQIDLGGLRAAFSHLLRVRREVRKGGRWACIQAALLRWLAFADAFPERLPRTDAGDARRLAEAAIFLREAAGRKRNPVAIRLRRAAAGFAEARSSGDVQEALHRLREAVLLDLRLPAVAQAALLSSPTEPLSDIARRELIYLARAGTRDVKVLAARRLQPERHHWDVRSTLEQLAYDPDAWVRAIVRT